MLTVKQQLCIANCKEVILILKAKQSEGSYYFIVSFLNTAIILISDPFAHQLLLCGKHFTSQEHSFYQLRKRGLLLTSSLFAHYLGLCILEVFFVLNILSWQGMKAPMGVTWSSVMP